MGAFILPNSEIPDQTDLRSFIAPVQAVESAAGLQLFNDDLKGKSRQLCAVDAVSGHREAVLTNRGSRSVEETASDDVHEALA